MSDTPGNFEGLLANVVRAVIREELAGLTNAAKTELVSPEELAERLKVPLSWVYEQSRQGNIPTHRLGRYIRFNLQEVIESQAKKA